MTHASSDRHLPPLAARLLGAMLTPAERDEVLDDVAQEHAERARTSGRRAADRWVWRQALSSLPLLARRGWWRGWSGFETRAERLQPGDAMFEGWAIDVRYALRRLRQRPTYTTLTVLTLALGVAGTAAVSGIARQLLWRPLPIRAAAEVVGFWFEESWSEADFAALRPEMDGFESLAAFRPADVTLQRRDGGARLVRGVAGTAELFRVLGREPALGRGFSPGDDLPGSEPVAVLSHALWRELGADSGIVGARIDLSGEPRTVVGVMPEGFWFPDPGVGVWLSQQLDPGNRSGNYSLIGRMPPGATPAAMEPQLDRMVRLLRERFDYPEQWDPTLNPELTPIRGRLLGPVRPALLALLGATALILLVAGVGGRGGRLEHGLVVAQVALVMMLTSAAALLVRSVDLVRAVDPGVEADRVAVIDVQLPDTVEPARVPALVQELIASVEVLPGVESVAATQRLPLRGSGDNWGLRVEDRPDLENTTTAFRVATPSYFRTLGTRLERGRGLLETDRDPGVEVGAVVVNKALVREYFPGVDPLGRRLASVGRWDRIVGVVDDVAPESLLDPARRAIQAAAPGVAVRELTTLESVVSRAVGPSLPLMSLLAVMAVLALVLGVIGIYGVISHFVSRRTRDWGIRVTLGLSPARLSGQIVGRAGVLAGAGIVAGLAGFFGLARLLAGFLRGVGPADPLALGGAVTVLLAAGLLAAAVPARRAGRIPLARVMRDS